jgi:CO/xanthine dehydrogenase Mo-binding subunit
MRIAGYDELRAEQAEKRGPTRPASPAADGHRHLVLHRGRRRRPAQAHGHPRARDGRRLRAAIHPTGKAVLRLSVQSQGQGHETTFAQIVAHELGIPPEDIEVVHGDTDNTPFGLGTYGSRSTPVSGAAAAVVARGSRTRPGSSRPRRSSARPTTSSGSTAGGSSRATPTTARRSRRSPARPRQPRAARGCRGPPRRHRGLRPAEPDLPVRCLHLRRRRRPGTGRSRSAGSSRSTTAARASTR